MPDCAAKSLIETTINSATDPVYTETVVKGALASMYGGVSPELSYNPHILTATPVAGTDTVSTFRVRGHAYLT